MLDVRYKGNQIWEEPAAMPTSYQAPMRKDQAKTRTQSQTTSSNLQPEAATVAHLLQGKGGDVFAIKPEETLGEAVKVLRDRRIGALIVTRRRRRAVWYPVGAGHCPQTGRYTGSDAAETGSGHYDPRGRDLQPARAACVCA